MFGVFRSMSFRNYCLLLLVCLYTAAAAQSDSLQHPAAVLRLSGMLDVFYVYDANRPQTLQRQAFLVSYNRHNQPNVNLGILKLGVDHARYRANLALQAGTYVRDNYATEAKGLRHLFEANAGISLNRRRNLWLDAGIFASHIGFESAVAGDNWTMTRSLLAENSPYYLTGLKLSHQPQERWEWAALLLSGWQRIQFLPGNSLPAIGTQVKFSPGKEISFNWSTFLGTNDPDSLRRMRYFNNLYGQFRISERWALIAGFDIGVQQKQKHSRTYDVWYSPVLIAQWTMQRQWKMALRGEYYHDPESVIIPTFSRQGFKTAGFSLNIDYVPVAYVLCRLEARWMRASDPVFGEGASLSHNNATIGSSLSMRFSELLRRRSASPGQK